MIRYGRSIRFTPHEIEAFCSIGLALSDASDQTSLEQELDRWTNIIASERLELLEKIALAMAEAKGLRRC